MKFLVDQFPKHSFPVGSYQYSFSIELPTWLPSSMIYKQTNVNYKGIKTFAMIQYVLSVTMGDLHYQCPVIVTHGVESLNAQYHRESSNFFVKKLEDQKNEVHLLTPNQMFKLGYATSCDMFPTLDQNYYFSGDTVQLGL